MHDDNLCRSEEKNNRGGHVTVVDDLMKEHFKRSTVVSTSNVEAQLENI